MLHRIVALVSLVLCFTAALMPASAQDVPVMSPKRKDVKPFEYVDANIPFYPPGKAASGMVGEAPKKMQLPLSPEESMKHLVHPADLVPQLFVAEDQLGGKPIAMTWDERGRLWVAVTVDYPNDLHPEGKGRDRILICEDTKATGRADKVTVFADKLSIPTSLTIARGGVIVQQAPHTLFLKDTDGDDRADVRQVLFTGWHTGDTHAGPSNLHYGLDNWIWGIVGYSGFNGVIGGEKHGFRQGFYRFRPDGSKFEFVRGTNNNSWGVGFSEDGLVFGSTANGNPSMYMPIANRYYESVRGWSSTVLGGIAQDTRFYPITDRVRQVDFHGRFTAAAGHALYTARTYPKSYWNRTAFVAEPTGHLIATFVLNRQGSNFTSRNAFNLLASDDEWTSPIMAEVGPDGNVWVIDWYSYIVQHNPTPRGFKTGKGNAYETSLRDKKHGRIYRLVYSQAKPQAALTLKDASGEKLVATLKNDNMLWRKHAQRLLVERGKLDVVPGLIDLVNDPGTDEIGLNVGAIHALWTLHALGAIEKDAKAAAAVVAALKHRSAGVRQNASLVLPHTVEAAKGLLASGALTDAGAPIRLAALLALAEMPPSEQAGTALVAMLARQDNLDDRWISDALTIAAAGHDLHFLRTLAPRKGLSARALDIVRIVAEHHARGGPVDSLPGIIQAYAMADARLTETLIEGLARGWPRDRKAKLPEEAEKTLAVWMAQLSPGTRGQLLKLAVAWGSGAIGKHADETAKSLLTLVGNEKEADEQRVAAARQLVEFRGEDAKLAETLLDAVTPRTSPQVAAGIIAALGASQSPAVAPAILQRIAGMAPAARTAALRTLLARPESTRLLLDAIEKGTIQFAELSLEQKQTLASHPDRPIAIRAYKLLERGGGLPNPDREKVVEQLLALTKKTGNADAGKAIFKNHCAKCHTHNGEGAKVGPDLTGMAVHPKSHLLIDVIDPSRNVEGNYRLYIVETKDGRILTGLLASETRTSVELLDPEGKKIILQRDNLESVTASPKSLMPDGFEKQVSETDLVNLLEFLTQRGKFLPLPLERVATAVSTRGMFNREDSTIERLVFPSWDAKTFEGIPFQLIDPKGQTVANVILLHGPQGTIPPKMPRSVRVPCNSNAKLIHMLGGVSGWGHPLGEKGSVSLIVRLHYADGQTEDHSLKNGEHFADYIRRVDVPGSKFAFDLSGRQVRYLAIAPKRQERIKEIEFVKGPDNTAPVVVAVTVESPE